MKTRLLQALVLSFAAAASSASAFTLDFATLASGTPVPNSPAQLVLSVPGYGNVGFSSAVGSSLEIVTMAGAGGPTKAINMDGGSSGGESLLVTFLGAAPSNVAFGFEQVGLGESMAVLAPTSNQYRVNFTGVNAGVSSVSFVPEPSALLLSSLGSLLLLRRRRA